MASMKLKATYALFLSSSLIWFSLILVACCLSGVWSNPVRFPNDSSLLLFLGSGVIASLSCFVIGLDYLGLSFKPKCKQANISHTEIKRNIPISQRTNATSKHELDETLQILVLPQPEEEQVVE
jgi:hypothetical protein